MKRLTIVSGGTTDPSGRRGREQLSHHARGDLVRIAPGRFVETAEWSTATQRQRHLARTAAVVERVSARSFVSHVSAVAVWGLPWEGELPDRVDVTDPHRDRAQTLPNVRKHAGADHISGIALIGGDRSVTDLVTTGVDIALSQPMRRSVPVLDAVLRRSVSRNHLRAALALRNTVRGAARARAAIEFADSRSDSLGESLCRLVVDELGAPTPELQHDFHDESGFVARVDFWFRDQGVVLEFDGAVKYLDRTMRGGRSASQVVVDEKRREDRLRRVAAVEGVVRCDTYDVRHPERLRCLLDNAGVPVRPPQRRHVR